MAHQSDSRIEKNIKKCIFHLVKTSRYHKVTHAEQDTLTKYFGYQVHITSYYFKKTRHDLTQHYIELVEKMIFSMISNPIMSFEIVSNKIQREKIIKQVTDHCNAFKRPYPPCIVHCQEYIEISEKDIQYILCFLPVSNISMKVEHFPIAHLLQLHSPSV